MITQLPNSVGYAQYTSEPTGVLIGDWFVHTDDGLITGYEIARGNHPSTIEGTYSVEIYSGERPSGTLTFSGTLDIVKVDPQNFQYKLTWNLTNQSTGARAVYTGVGIGGPDIEFSVIWNNNP